MCDFYCTRSSSLLALDLSCRPTEARAGRPQQLRVRKAAVFPCGPGHSKESDTETTYWEKEDFYHLFLIFFHLFRQLKGKKPPAASSGVTGKGKAASSQQRKADSTASVKRMPSSKFPPGPCFWVQVRFAELRL